MDSCFRGNDVIVLCGMRCLVGLGGISVEFPRARELWIPAFAGMTYLFLVPMLLRGNLWAALGWLLLERQVCIPTRERGNEETEET